MEILAYARDQADAGIEARNEEDRREQHLPGPAEQRMRKAGQRVRAGLAAREGSARQRTRVRQHGIYREQHRARDPARAHRAAHDLLVVIHASGADVERDDRAEVERRKRVHRLIAGQQALRHGLRHIAPARRAVMRRYRVDQAARKQHHDQDDQRRAEDLAQAVGQLFRSQRHEKGHGEKQHRIDKLLRRPAADERHEHLKRGARRARDGEARADGQVAQQRKHRRKARMHPRGKRGQAARPRNRDHAEHRQADRAHRKAEERQPGIRARLRPEKGREDQIARPEKHGEQSETHQKQVPPPQFLHICSLLPFDRFIIAFPAQM